MEIERIVSAIQEMKLDVPSSDIVEVKMEYLEEIVRYINKLQETSLDRFETIKRLNSKIDAMGVKIDMMNTLSKECRVKPKLDTYI